MSERIARPSFYEGQVLRAADLDLGLEYARGTMARHERYLHTRGIATGLELTVDESTGLLQVRLSAGMAVDAAGRQIVVDREETLAPEVMESQGVLRDADTDSTLTQEQRPWHPVFLTGADESSSLPAFARGCGSGTQPSRLDEAYRIDFGLPGETDDEPASVAVSDGPDATPSPRVLIGFVQWDGTSNFGDAKAAPKKGLAAPYAGVRADEVVARSGTLVLRADQGRTRDKKPALVFDGEDGGEMRFGLQDARGDVTTVFSVNAAGDVFVGGVIKSPFANDLWVESGTISDGMTIPLPAGVTQEKVDAGEIVLHVVVTPRRVAELLPPGATTVGPHLKEPFECRVSGRRVFVRERWFDFTASPPTTTTMPAACDYVIVASASGRAS